MNKMECVFTKPTQQRSWWNDENRKAELTAKIESSENWYVSFEDNVPAKVIKLIYAGYKVLLPDNTERTVNPDSMMVTDVSSHDYPQLAALWTEKQSVLNAEKAARDAVILAEKIALQELQNSCLHVHTATNQVMKAAGCDMDDTHCTTCNKVLRRSWSTAYDRDPDDHISDWAWWEREYMRLYQQVPKRSDYKVVEKIGDEY